MNIPVIQFEQPIGTFLLAAMNAEDVLKISKANPRKFDSVNLNSYAGPQREPSWKRIKEIAEYSETVDATFPTPVLLAIDSDNYTLDNNVLTITGDKVADIVDGQHRLLGLKESSKTRDFVLPVVFILDPIEEEKALIFAIINGKQTKVPASLIYDLFGVTEKRSPQKSVHEIARSLNSDTDSPWYRRLKMLGKKTPGSIESLSQGTFVKFVLPLISADPIKDMDLIKREKEPIQYPNCIFNEYWREDKDHIILKILLNLFRSVRKQWPEEWDEPESSILTRAIGFSGIIRALPDVFMNGKQRGDLSEGYFDNIFEMTRIVMEEKQISFSSQDISISASGEAQIRDAILESLRRLP